MFPYMATLESFLVPKVPMIFSCIICDYNTSRKSQYERHLLTPKHVKSTKTGKIDKKGSTGFTCDNCNKLYKERSGLWKHAKKCNMTDASNNEIKVLTNLVLELVKSNNQMVELCKTNTTTIINNNSNNKTFNLQLFLNEECKDAMNMINRLNCN